MSLLMVDHALCSQTCLTEGEFFLGPSPSWLRLDFISSFTSMDLYGSVFPVLRLFKVLGLIYIDMAFHHGPNMTNVLTNGYRNSNSRVAYTALCYSCLSANTINLS